MTEAARLEERRDELTESVEDFAVYSEKDRAIAGVIVTIGDDGEFRLHEGFVEHSAIDAEDSGNDETVQFEARKDDDISRCSPNAEQALRKECGFSQLLVDDLIRGGKAATSAGRAEGRASAIIQCRQHHVEADVARLCPRVDRRPEPCLAA